MNNVKILWHYVWSPDQTCILVEHSGEEVRKPSNLHDVTVQNYLNHKTKLHMYQSGETMCERRAWDNWCSSNGTVLEVNGEDLQVVALVHEATNVEILHIVEGQNCFILEKEGAIHKLRCKKLVHYLYIVWTLSHLLIK